MTEQNLSTSEAFVASVEEYKNGKLQKAFDHAKTMNENLAAIPEDAASTDPKWAAVVEEATGLAKAVKTRIAAFTEAKNAAKRPIIDEGKKIDAAMKDVEAELKKVSNAANDVILAHNAVIEREAEAKRQAEAKALQEQAEQARKDAAQANDPDAAEREQSRAELLEKEAQHTEQTAGGAVNTKTETAHGSAAVKEQITGWQCTDPKAFFKWMCDADPMPELFEFKDSEMKIGKTKMVNLIKAGITPNGILPIIEKKTSFR